MWLDEITGAASGCLPFKFFYGGEDSRTFLGGWGKKNFGSSAKYFEDEKNGGLEITADIKIFGACPAFDLQIKFENTGDADTKAISGLSTLYFELDCPLPDGSYIIRRANGGLSTKDDFVQSDVVINCGGKHSLAARGGRSSNADLPFFRIDAGKGSVIVAVGWTGQWRCDFANENNRLVVSAGIENADFFMRPGEKFAFGSMAALFYKSGPNFENFEANNLFRKLLLDEYLPKIADRGGLKKTPYLFCNTCFTRGGHWLNECNEKNQISLIKALEPLGCEAAITDAGWFEKGWPLGAGNWDADPEKYPDGFLPVSNAAKDAGMKYGLWFEFERVVAGTEFAKTCGDWLLSSETGKLWGESGDEHFLLNLGVPEAVDHIYGIIEKKIKAEGIKCYRQDFNLNPLSYWLKNDEPGRAGVTEIKYVNGLYGYLDRIRTNFPDVFMDGCSSGGRRIDLEMLKRFHTHQKTDFWFDPAVDQNSLFSLSHYIPNVAFTAHVNCFDDYGFNSAMAATLCLGWIADGNGEYGGKGKYEAAGAKKLIERYNGIRPFLNCSFYPLTEPNEKDAAALAFEFFDEEKNSGAIFIFAREKCGLKKIELKLKGIEDGKIYSLKDLATDKIFEAAGKDLKEGFVVNIDELPFTKVYKIEQKNNCLA